MLQTISRTLRLLLLTYAQRLWILIEAAIFTQPLHSPHSPEFSPILHLSVELIDNIVDHLPTRDIPNLALTCKHLSEISLRHLYTSVVISSSDDVDGVFDRACYKRRLNVMQALVNDPTKRGLVRKLELRDFCHPYTLPPASGGRNTFEESMEIVEKQKRNEEARTSYFELMNQLIGNDFPGLVILVWQDECVLGLKGQRQTFLAFLLRNVSLQTITSRIHPAEIIWLTFGLVPILNYMKDTLLIDNLVSYCHPWTQAPVTFTREDAILSYSLQKAHFSWPPFQKVPDRPTPIAYIGALTMCCGDTLRILKFSSDDPCRYTDLLELIAVNFPHLVELEFLSLTPPSSSQSGVLEPMVIPMIRRLGQLQRLERLAYIFSRPNEDLDYSISTPCLYHPNAVDSDEIVEFYCLTCPSLKYFVLGLQTWERSNGRLVRSIMSH